MPRKLHPKRRAQHTKKLRSERALHRQRVLGTPGIHHAAGLKWRGQKGAA